MVNRTGKRRAVPPSRKRYEATNPTVSFRIGKDLYEELRNLKTTAGLSVADVLKVGLERCEPLAGQAYSNGYMEALADAYLGVCEDCQFEIMDLIPAEFG